MLLCLNTLTFLFIFQFNNFLRVNLYLKNISLCCNFLFHSILRSYKIYLSVFLKVFIPLRSFTPIDSCHFNKLTIWNGITCVLIQVPNNFYIFYFLFSYKIFPYILRLHLPSQYCQYFETVKLWLNPVFLININFILVLETIF